MRGMRRHHGARAGMESADRRTTRKTLRWMPGRLLLRKLRSARVRAVQAEAQRTRPLVLQTSFSAPSSLGCLGRSCKGRVGLADLRSAGRTRVVWPNARATGQHDRGKRRSSPA